MKHFDPRGGSQFSFEKAKSKSTNTPQQIRNSNPDQSISDNKKDQDISQFVQNKLDDSQSS